LLNVEDYYREELSYIFEVNSNLFLEVKRMKRKMIVMAAALLLLASILLPAIESLAAVLDAGGDCDMTVSGKEVTYSGSTTSSKSEDIIRVTVTLWEKRNGTWHSISSVTKTKENAISVSKSKTVTVSGGHYYKVTADHYVQTGSNSSTTNSYTSSVWIPN
jgi:hypothetical protein